MKQVATVVAFLVSLFVMSTPVFAIHKTVPAETEPLEEQGITIRTPSSKPDGPYRLQALVNLLINKGIISNEEFQKEIDMLKKK